MTHTEYGVLEGTVEVGVDRHVASDIMHGSIRRWADDHSVLLLEITEHWAESCAPGNCEQEELPHCHVTSQFWFRGYDETDHKLD